MAALDQKLLIQLITRRTEILIIRRWPCQPECQVQISLLLQNLQSDHCHTWFLRKPMYSQVPQRSTSITTCPLGTILIRAWSSFRNKKRSNRSRMMPLPLQIIHPLKARKLIKILLAPKKNLQCLWRGVSFTSLIVLEMLSSESRPWTKLTSTQQPLPKSIQKSLLKPKKNCWTSKLSKTNL